jgi:hypothetical protein
MLLDYNDIQKLPFYDMLDKALNQDGLKLRYAANSKSLTFPSFLLLDSIRPPDVEL